MPLVRAARCCLLLACASPLAFAGQGDEMMQAVMAECPGAARHIHRAGVDAVAQKHAEHEGMRSAPALPTHSALRDELLEMVRQDQAARQGDLGDPAVWQRIAEVDARNLVRFKQVVATQGLPDNSKVGRDGLGAAWLLVQHADRDPAFQQQMLELMIEKRLIEGEQLAMLTDRVLRAQGKPQRYGSQFTEEAGRQVPQPIEEPVDKLDERRASMGMMPFADYQCAMGVMYPAKKR